MNAWLDTGERPNTSLFPTAPPFLFNAAFTPGSWIF